MLRKVFFMGLQSTFFGPLKYSILPQHVARNESTKANGFSWNQVPLYAILFGHYIWQPIIFTKKAGAVYITLPFYA